MKRSSRLFFFILLNVLVSLCTTLGVLVLWDQLRGPLPKGVLSNLFGNRGEDGAVPPLSTPVSTGTAIPPTQACIPYQAQQGDTFESLAERYKISAAEIRSANGFSADQQLKTGDLICIPSSPQGTVVIKNVVGAGDLETEHIALVHQGEGTISLSGWRIEDGRGNAFIFPLSSQLELYGGGGIDIYTRSGANSVIELFWGLDKPVWSSGTTVTLRDAQGNIRATYVVP